MTPSVSVLIPTFNRAQFLRECLDSVLAQTFPPAQVIVINDGSTDNTRDVLRSYMERIEYLEQENGGKASALNLGLSKVLGDYVWIMDDDDAALPDALETHLAVLESDKGIGFTYTSAYRAKTAATGTGLEILGRWWCPEVRDDELFAAYLEFCFFPHSAMLARTSCYRAVGAFDVTLLRSQEYDMNLRISRRFPGRRIDKPTVLIRQHTGLRGASADRFEVGRRRLKWREYERKILLRLRGELGLNEYLPVSLRSQLLGPLETRRAYLQRMAAMGRRGLISEMVEDLRLALATESDSSLSLPERKMVCRCFADFPSSDLSDLRQVRFGMASRWGRTGREIKIEIARGLFWQAEACLRSIQFGGLAEIVKVAYQILGVRGIAAAVRTKICESLSSPPRVGKPSPNAPSR